jgi:hypothetical protein
MICIEMDTGGTEAVWKLIESAMGAISNLQNELA